MTSQFLVSDTKSLIPASFPCFSQVVPVFDFSCFLTQEIQTRVRRACVLLPVSSRQVGSATSILVSNREICDRYLFLPATLPQVTAYVALP